MIRTHALALLACAGAACAQPVIPTFAPATSRSLPGQRANGKVELADVTGDGRLDAVMTDLIDNIVRVLPQNPGGSFADPVLTAFSGNTPDWDPVLALADFNGDGRADLATGLHVTNFPSPGWPNIAALLGAPNGMFINRVDYNNQPAIAFPNAPHDRGLALKDVNHDGLPDLVSPSNNDFNAGTGCQLVVMLNDGAGHFGPPMQSGQGACAGTDFLLVGDLTGDGNQDAIVVANTGSNSHAHSAFWVSIGDGAGRFTAAGTFTLDFRTDTGGGNCRVFLTDLDGDGRADLVAFGRGGSQSGAGGLYVLRSNGNGTFTTTLRIGYFGAPFGTIGVGDLNGDNRPEIILPGLNGAPGSVRVNDGAGGFSTTAPFPGLGEHDPRDVAVGRLDGAALPSVVIEGVSDAIGEARLFTIFNTTPAPAACYANCDQSTAAPTLNVLDFNCFLNRFSSGDPYANCDASTAPPTLNVLDFNCFLNRFSAGCP